MNQNPTPNFEIPTEMRDFAEKSVEQARKAFDGFLGTARRALDTFEGSATTVQSSAKDATRKSMEYAEQNVSAAFDLAQKLVRSKDVQEAMQHQAEFVRTQLAAMQSQMKDFGSMAKGAIDQVSSATRGAAEQGQKAAEQGQKAAKQNVNQGKA
jgi:phasin